ncbi:MAG: hypothetical protein QXH24_02705 [Candidatus Bathyarchaeia archaeon]
MERYKRLEEEYHWIKLGEVKGIIKTIRDLPSKEEYDLVLLPNQDFSKNITSTINLSGPARLTKLFVRIIGPEIIFATKKF